MLNELLNLEDLNELYNPEGFFYLIAILVIFYAGKVIYGWAAPYDLDEQLTSLDNKAEAVSFTGYMLGIGVIMWGVVANGQETEIHLFKDLLDTVIWGIIGIALLQTSKIINDKIIFSRFDNVKEIINDKNVGTGAVQFGSFLGSAFIIMGVITGESGGLIEDVINTIIFFILGQIGFILFSKLFQATTRFDLHAEIEKDNVSAGVGFGMTLAAMGLLLSNSIIKYDSIFAFAVWFLLSAALLIVLRYLVDKLILPGQLLDEEISRDQNWGAALINGGMAVIIALLVNRIY